MIPSMSSEFDCFETCAWSMNEAPWNKEKDKIGQLPINRTNLTGLRKVLRERVDYFRPTREIYLKLRWELNDDLLDVF